MSSRKERQRLRLEAEREELRKLQVTSDDPASQAIIEEIYSAFAGVGRQGGRTWNEADLLDDYGIGPGHFPDVNPLRWEELVTDPRWYGSWCYGFLDAKGFRFYIPVGMVRSLSGNPNADPTFSLGEESRFSDDGEDRWQTMTNEQIHSICSYLRHVEENHAALTWETYAASRP